MSQVIPLRLKISNAFLIKGEKLALVDTGSPKDTSGLVGAITKAGIDIKGLSLIVHTHAHSDHCGSTAYLRQTTGGPCRHPPGRLAGPFGGEKRAHHPCHSDRQAPYALHARPL